MNEDNKNSKKKDDLLDILRNAKFDAQEITSKGREIVKQGQFIADLASCNEEFFSSIPDDSFLPQRQWDNQIDVWSRLHDYASSAITKLNDMDRLSFATDSTTISSSGAITTAYISNLPPQSQVPARRAVERFSQILRQSNQVQELETEIQRLGLTASQSNNESILSLLHQAEQAFKVPSVLGVSPSAVLIPLREAINRTFADLLPRRQEQEKTKNNQEKVRSICTHFSRSGVDNNQIEQLAVEAYDLNKILSEAKQEVMSRDLVGEVMNRGFVFLRSFLRTLDENKMKI